MTLFLLFEQTLEHGGVKLVFGGACLAVRVGNRSFLLNEQLLRALKEKNVGNEVQNLQSKLVVMYIFVSATPVSICVSSMNLQPPS